MGGAIVEERVDGELKLAGVRAGSGGVLEVRGGELARELGDWDVGVPLVLKHTRVGEPGLFPELATAAAMWRPRSTTGAAWRGEEGSSAGGSGARGLRGCRVWRWSSRRWPPGLPEWQWRRSAPAAEAAEREEEDNRLDLFANSEKFRGPTVKQKYLLN